jgi:hypothetical protein
MILGQIWRSDAVRRSTGAIDLVATTVPVRLHVRVRDLLYTGRDRLMAEAVRTSDLTYTESAIAAIKTRRLADVKLMTKDQDLGFQRGPRLEQQQPTRPGCKRLS